MQTTSWIIKRSPYFLIYRLNKYMTCSYHPGSSYLHLFHLCADPHTDAGSVSPSTGRMTELMNEKVQRASPYFFGPSQTSRGVYDQSLVWVQRKQTQREVQAKQRSIRAVKRNSCNRSSNKQDWPDSSVTSTATTLRTQRAQSLQGQTQPHVLFSMEILLIMRKQDLNL